MMNCVDLDCKFCKAKDIKIDSEIIPYIMRIYCEKGKNVHIPFNDDGKHFTCKYYEKRVKNES